MRVDLPLILRASVPACPIGTGRIAGAETRVILDGGLWWFIDGIRVGKPVKAKEQAPSRQFNAWQGSRWAQHSKLAAQVQFRQSLPS